MNIQTAVQRAELFLKKIQWLHLEITITAEEIVLEGIIETINLMVIGINLVIIFQIVIIFKEKFQEEITIMPQN